MRGTWGIQMSAPGKPEARSHNVEDGERKQIAPAEVHELVIAEAGQRSAHPDVDTEKENYLDYKPEQRHKDVDECVLEMHHPERVRPAAQKKQRGHTANVDHVAVFGHEEHGELHGAVFGVVAASELAFG